MGTNDAFHAHVKTGLTTICRCWSVERRDGLVLGFTDHDRDLAFEGITFKADSGLGAKALQQSTGLAVDNSEAVGLLSSEAITEADIQAGRFDEACVWSWLVNWRDPSERSLQFCGTLGELQRAGGSFQAELRGLTEGLNQPQGSIYQKSCSAILGDAQCKFDLSAPGYSSSRPVERVEDQRIFHFADLSGFDERWFERGKLTLLSGAAEGLVGVVKNDRLTPDGRVIELWESFRAPIVEGDLLRLDAGCDKASSTCKLKFHNFLNFRGFPDIPGDDWLMAYPVQAGVNDGGSLVR